MLQNYDNVAVQPKGYGTGITSGRWFLTVLGDIVGNIFGNYNLTWINGIIGILLIAFAAYFLIDIFKIRSNVFAVLLGIGCVSFPSVASCMLFKYTVSYYSFAILLSVLAAYVVINEKMKNHVLWTVVSGLFTACSLGIYQAYLPVTVSIFVLYLLQQIILNKENWNKIIYKGLHFVFCLFLGLLFYFVFLKISLFVYGVLLDDYQGISTMGKLSFTEIPRLIKESFLGYYAMPNNNTYVLAPYPAVKYIYKFWNIASLIMIIVCLVRRRAKIIQWGIAAVMCLCFPVAVNLLVIMCPDSWIYTLMVYSFVMVLFMPVVVFEALPETPDSMIKYKRFFKVFLSFSIGLVTFFYAYVANITYTAEYYANRQVENLAGSIVTQVRETENFKPDCKWVFLGYYFYNDPLMDDLFENAPIYEGEGNPNRLVNSYSWTAWIRSYIGYSIPLADDETQSAIAAKQEVKDMPSWPSNGSIRIIDDVVVIKFSD